MHSIPLTSAHWLADLKLGFTRIDSATVLSERRHCGPLRVQKALYPESEAVCQAIVLHPPSGIAGGDQLAGDDALLGSAASWAGANVSGTLLATLQPADDAPALLAACRALQPADGAECAISALPGVLVARYLGDNSEAARHWFVALWQLLRPALLGRATILPRIWTT